MSASQLGQFIERIEMQPSLSQVDLLTSTDVISISISEPAAGRRIALQIPCELLDWQLSSMIQICNHFPPFLSRVKNLGITALTPTGRDDMDREKWVELIRSFRGAVDFRTAGALVADILLTLSLDVGESNVLPSLRTLRVPELLSDHEALREAIKLFTSSRRLSGHLVNVYAGNRHACGICDASYARRSGLKRHLADKHLPKNVCPHCKSFVRSPGRRYIFLRHLEEHHPGAALTDTPISDPALQYFTSSHYGTHAPSTITHSPPDITIHTAPGAILPMTCDFNT